MNLGYSRQASYEVEVIRNVMVPMRDGIRLATDVYLPSRDGHAADGRFPAILDRTPYLKVPRAVAGNDPEYFVRRGYAFVLQDERGHGDSEGEFDLYVNTGPDGCDTVKWIKNQPWSNGVIVASGYSYDAAAQHAIAREGSRLLAAMFSGFGAASYHKDIAGTNGAFRLAHNLLYSLAHARRDRIALHDKKVDTALQECEKDILAWFKRPLSEHARLFKDVPRVQSWYLNWVNHQDYDEYWKQNGYCFEGFYEDFPDIPIYYFGGWWDTFNRGTIKNYTELSKMHKSPTFLTMGPWTHGVQAARESWAGDVDFGSDSAVDWNGERLRFFDEAAMKMDTGLSSEPPVRVFVMGGGSGRRNSLGKLEHGGHWRTSRTWPIQETAWTNFYLREGGRLGTELPSEVDSSSSWAFDPDDPVPQIGGGYTYPWMVRGVPGGTGPWNQVCSDDIPVCKAYGYPPIPLSAREDVLVFQTRPLEADVEITGPLLLKFWASSSATDTDFTAKLIDLYPPSADYPSGYAMYIIDSIIRARYRKALEEQILMEPGKIYEFAMDMWNTSNLFKKGHSIRLDFSSSNFPTFDVNPNTGEKIGYHTGKAIAHNTIYHDKQHPSHLIAPVIPAA